ncbi:MAG: DUF1853 family protein [Burkholderiaceae bacterium]
MSDIDALRWLLTSPPLLSEQAAAQYGSSAQIAQFSTGELQHINAWLDALAAQPQPLADWLAAARATVRGHQPGVLRLGRLAERLLEFYLQHGPTHQLIAANLPLRYEAQARQGIDHTTRGEIDFLLHDTQGTPLHWELAVKYFLCHAQGGTANAQDFIGPDGAETLHTKLEKLFKRQLAHVPPLQSPTGSWQPQAFTRGWMFYRYAQPIPSCSLLDPRHCKGRWLLFDELDALPDSRYVLLDRQHWMPPVRGAQETQCMRGDALSQQLLHAWSQARGPHISALLIAQVDQQGDEEARYFVLPEKDGSLSAKAALEE